MTGSGFGQRQESRIKLELREQIAAPALRGRGAPVQPPGNHEVQHQKRSIVKANRDSFPDAADFSDSLANDRLNRRLNRAQQERSSNQNIRQFVTGGSFAQRLHVDCYVRELGHEGQPRNPMARPAHPTINHSVSAKHAAIALPVEATSAASERTTLRKTKN